MFFFFVIYMCLQHAVEIKKKVFSLIIAFLSIFHTSYICLFPVRIILTKPFLSGQLPVIARNCRFLENSSLFLLDLNIYMYEL